MKKRTTAKKTTARKTGNKKPTPPKAVPKRPGGPSAKKGGAAHAASRAGTRSAGRYEPPPLSSSGWAPFRYPPQ
jgi:hypothetical protein